MSQCVGYVVCKNQISSNAAQEELNKISLSFFSLYEILWNPIHISVAGDIFVDADLYPSYFQLGHLRFRASRLYSSLSFVLSCFQRARLVTYVTLEGSCKPGYMSRKIWLSPIWMSCPKCTYFMNGQIGRKNVKCRTILFHYPCVCIDQTFGVWKLLTVN